MGEAKTCSAIWTMANDLGSHDFRVSRVSPSSSSREERIISARQ